MKKILFFAMLAFQCQALDHQIRLEAVSMKDHQVQSLAKGVRITDTIKLSGDNLAAEIRLESVQSRNYNAPMYWQNVQFFQQRQNTPSQASAALLKNNLIKLQDLEIGARGGVRQLFGPDGVNDTGYIFEPRVRYALGAMTLRAGYEISNSLTNDRNTKYNIKKLGVGYNLTPGLAVVTSYELQRGYLHRTVWTFGVAFQK